MIRRIHNFLHRFRQEESGSVTVEFVIMFPVFMFILMAGVEMGVIALRQANLERAMDLTVRDIRLGTGSAPQHDDIKQAICDRAPMIKECTASLKLEMIRVNPQQWQAPPATPDCVDRSEQVNPVRAFVHGNSNELMILRACARFKPLFPLSGIGKELKKDNAGYAAVSTTTAFVQEPR